MRHSTLTHSKIDRPFKKTLRNTYPIAAISAGVLLQVQAAQAETRPSWTVVDKPSASFREWRTISKEQLGSREPGQPEKANSVGETAEARMAKVDSRIRSPWILGVGGGARIGVGEPTYPMIYSRIGRIVGSDVALSLRPRYVFGNSDLQGNANKQGAFQIPLTVDLVPNHWISPYLGGGIATATDSTNKTDSMLSIGADLQLGSNISLDLGLNYIFQSRSTDSNQRDVELTSVIYLRF